MEKRSVDFAVIGAGAAGTYTAWRLKTDPKTKGASVAVFDPLEFEGKPRIGGRLWSPRLAGLGDVRCAELGGMRYLSSQIAVASLVDHLKLKSVPFDVDSNTTLYNLRGRVLRGSEIFDPQKIPYQLGPQETGQSPGELLANAIQNVVPNAPYLSTQEWEKVQRAFKVDGEPLYMLGFWNLLQRVLSQEGYSYVQDGQGYNTIVSNWNASDAMPWTLADFHPGVSYMYVHEGYQRLPETLLELAQKAGATFHPWRLASWEFAAGGTQLEFDGVASAKGRTLHAKNLILATPRRALELISMPANPELKFMLGSVEPQPMFKFFAGYDYPWWRSLGLTQGRTITDTPLRQIYYWGSNYSRFYDDGGAKTRGVPNRPEHSMLMTYLDGRDVSFWQSLFEPLGRNSPFGIIDSLTKPSPETRSMLNFVQTNLRATHGISYIPEPYTIAYADWTADPFGGAYNLWKPGYKSWEITDAIRSPYGGKPVYICGEAYSLKQGWVEGALETSEQMLEDNLGLARPEWLPANYLS